MAGRFEGTDRDRPSDRGGLRVPRRRENDRSSARGCIEIRKTTDGPPGVGTRYASTVKDAGMKTKREFELTEFDAPTRIRWAERSKNLVRGRGRLRPRARAARETG